MKTYIQTILLFIILIGLSCREESTSPDDTPTGRRDYTWTADTLRDEPGADIWPFEIWGNSPNDVWVVCNGNASDHCKWHFDGIKWHQDSVRISSYLNSVFGFAQNDVWACEGPGGKIFHYDGTNWSLFGDYEPADSQLNLASICGETSSNVYIVGSMESLSGGYRGIIMHYDGGGWNFVPVPLIKTKLYWIRKDYTTGLYFIWGKKGMVGNDTTEIYKYDGNKTECIYSDVQPMCFGQVGNTVLFNDTKHLYSFYRGNFILWRDFSNERLMGGRVWGRSLKDVIAGRNGIISELIHYNGTNWKPILQLPSASIWSIFLFSGDVFVLSRDLNNAIIYHGKLN